MPPRPFPLLVSIGTDIQHVTRIRSLLTKIEPADRLVQLNRFMNRFLTHMEQKQFWARFRPLTNETSEVASSFRDLRIPGLDWDVISKHLSGRWAAKEAVIKAFTWRKLSPLNVVILKTQSAGHQAPLYALVTDRACASQWTTSTRARRSTDLLAVHGQLDTFRAGDVLGCEEAVGTEDADAEATAGGEYIPPHKQHAGMDGQIAKISISHDGDYATAVCLAAEEPMAGDVGGEMQARAFC